MKPTKLSSRRAIAALEPKGQPYIVWAGDLPGFGLRVQPTGVKTFILRYRPRGAGRGTNQRTLTLGRFPALTPEQARDLATAALARVVSGGDPSRERPVPTTVGDVLGPYHRSLEGRASYRIVGSDIRLHLKPALGKILASELTAHDVRKMSDRLIKQGKRTRAGACVRLLRAAYRHAGLDPAVFAAVKAAAWRKRKRAASLEELSAVLAACDLLLERGEEWPFSIYLVLLLILTGARPGEWRTAKWTDIKYGQLVRTEHKTAQATGEPREIELTAHAAELLERIPRFAGNPYVLPGRKRGQPVVSYARTWQAICKAAGVTGLQVRDLRRTFASIALGEGASVDQIGRALGHSQSGTALGYAWLLPEHRRLIAERVGAIVTGLNGAPRPQAQPSAGQATPRAREGDT